MLTFVSTITSTRCFPISRTNKTERLQSLSPTLWMSRLLRFDALVFMNFINFVNFMNFMNFKNFMNFINFINSINFINYINFNNFIISIISFLWIFFFFVCNVIIKWFYDAYELNEFTISKNSLNFELWLMPVDRECGHWMKD